MAEKQLKLVKSMLRATLTSSKEGIPAVTLLRDYQELTGESLPFKSLGFSSLKEFIQSIPDVVKVIRNPAGEIILHAVADESNKHMLKLVSKQKMKKTRKLSEARKPLSLIPTQRTAVFERMGSRPNIQDHDHVGLSKSANVSYQNITDVQKDVARTQS